MLSPNTLAELGIVPGVLSTLERLVVLFEKWNRAINLSAASTRDELIEHVEDSLHVVPHLRDCARVLDVGSGGGFPVLVAAICLPATQFTALEPVHKKHAFLRTAARELALANLDARAERLEDHTTHDYDAAMSRATFALEDWLVRGAAFVRDSGRVLGFEAIPQALSIAVERHEYALANKTRAIVVFHVERR